MILIDNIIVDRDVVEEDFVCNIKKCKGACCWEGDYGAPLEEEEKEILAEVYEEVKNYLPRANKAEIDKKGLYVYYQEPKEFGTSLMPDGACTFLVKDESGISYCSIEKAYRDGLIPWKKPISCELYPIRIEQNEQNGFEQLVYDRWDICSNLCDIKKDVKLPLFEFVKNAIIRKYGEEFYEQLEGAAKHSKSNK